MGDELSNEMPCLEVPNFDASVATAADNPRVIELQARNAVIVRCKPMDGTIAFYRPDADRAIRSTRDKCITTHLKLSNQRRVALKDANTVAKTSTLVVTSSPRWFVVL